MKHFSYYPKISYPASADSLGVPQDFRTCSNLMLLARFRQVLRKNTLFFYPYTIHDEDRPDIIAHKYYGSPNYAWVVLYANDMIDPLYDWPLPYPDFISYLKAKYGSIEYTHSNVKEYLNANGFEVDYDTWLTIPVAERDSNTIYEWENRLNEEKRNIRLLEDKYLSSVLNEFRTIMRG